MNTKNKFLSVALMGMCSCPLLAQETYQNTKLAENGLTGTARYVGMGGAMEALGADISTMSTNPAGIGMLRRGQVSLSAGVVAQSDVSGMQVLQDAVGAKKSRPSFDQIGFVWSTAGRNRQSYVNLGFNFHKSTNFSQILTAANGLSNASQNKLTALKNRADAPGWTAVDANYGGYEAKGEYHEGLLTLAPSTEKPDEYYLNWENANAFGYAQYQKGYIGVYDFNISGAINNKVWLGLTLGIHDVNYKSTSVYVEDLADKNNAISAEAQQIDGTGFDVKAGVIFRPVENSPFRIGLYVNSPVFYDLTLKAANAVAMKGDNPVGGYKDAAGVEHPAYTIGEGRQTVSYDFRLNTPWRVGASVGHTIGNYLALGATYEYAWYANMDTRVKTGAYYDGWGNYVESSTSDEVMNADTRDNLKGVSTLKLGLEYKPISMLALRLGYNYQSPMFDKNGTRNVALSSYGTTAATSTDYTNWEAISRLTLGVGFSYQKLFIDVAYQYSAQNGTFYPFMSYYENGVNGAPSDYDCDAPATKVSNKRHQLLMTIGYRF